MSYPAMLTDAGGNIMPQYWDGAAWQPYEGEDRAAAPAVILTIPYTDFTSPNYSYSVALPAGTLTRSAKRRTIHIINNLNVHLDQFKWQPYDSTIKATYGNIYGGGFNLTGLAYGGGGGGAYESVSYPSLGAAVDSAIITVTTTSSDGAPTSGDAYIYLTEVL